MGVIYKLKPETRERILDFKKSNPDLSCRKLVSLVSDKLKLKVSKSSINAIIKGNGLSMPVGRRRKPRRGALQAQGLGVILLKACDYLIGGSHYINEAVCSRLKKEEAKTLTKIESLIYAPLFGLDAKDRIRQETALWQLVGERFFTSDLNDFLVRLQGFPSLPADISRSVSGLLQEVRCLKINLSEGSPLFLDGQLHTVWSTPYLPYDFSATVQSIKHCLQRCFKDAEPVILSMAPGYDIPTREFLELVYALDSSEGKFSTITLYGNKLEELDVATVEKSRRRFFIFGLWPWQFAEYRRVVKLGETRAFTFEPLKTEFYLSEMEVELSQPNLNRKSVFRGCALKTEASGKIRLIILSNMPSAENSAERLAGLYLNRWPNLEESFHDFSRKVELFTYAATSQFYFSSERLPKSQLALEDIKAFFEYYLGILDLYCRWHIFPAGYENKDFSFMRENFYNLKGKLKKEKNCLVISLEPPEGYAFLKDLEYALRRINEKEVILLEGLRLWCRVS